MKEEIANIRRELQLYRLILRDKRTPLHAKLLLGLAIGYAMMPVDAIPGFIPILGQLDDILAVPSLAYAALKMIPPQVVEDCRKRV